MWLLTFTHLSQRIGIDLTSKGYRAAISVHDSLPQYTFSRSEYEQGLLNRRPVTQLRLQAPTRKFQASIFLERR